MGVVVHIDKFSGPMALLLHLIRREEMDIFDINIQEITKQYLDSIKAMKKLNLELAGDFISMASTLIQIKSKMLLPQYNEMGEEIVAEDPRKDLVQRLLEYQMYQEAGHNLYARNIMGRNVWVRGLREEIKVDDGEIILEEENALYALIAAYRATVKKMKKAVHRVANSLQSIADRIWQMRELLVVGRQTRMSELAACGPSLDAADAEVFKEQSKGRILITFLSLLELAKMGLVNLFQGENFEDIHVDTKKEINKDAISNVENYESQIGDNESGVKEIWLNQEDQGLEEIVHGEVTNEDLPPVQMDLVPAATVADTAFEITAATDEEIELEEKLYGEQEQKQESSDEQI